jgi:hypothetical protein
VAAAGTTMRGTRACRTVTTTRLTIVTTISASAWPPAQNSNDLEQVFKSIPSGTKQSQSVRLVRKWLKNVLISPPFPPIRDNPDRNYCGRESAPQYSEPHRFLMPFCHKADLKNDFLKKFRPQEGKKRAFFVFP